MNNTLKGALFFVSGAAIASFITFKILDKKYKDMADEEIKSVKETYERKNEKLKQEIKELKSGPKTVVVEEVKPEPTQAAINPYSSLVNSYGYLETQRKIDEKETKKEMVENRNVEIIPPEEFGEYGYKCVSLTYYADKALTFEDNSLIKDVNKYVGSKALDTFGEYEDDSVFVRNHEMKTDFEILLDSRNYFVEFEDLE